MSFVDKSGHERHEVRLRWWDPGHEEGNIVENVPPHDRAIKREIQGYGGPFDKIECRLMDSQPSVCP
jgi:hypothetical protein